MRARLVLALSVIGGITGIAGATAAAADLPYQFTSRDTFFAQRAAPLVIYAYQPGVTMREYWLPPWHNRHYFPHSNKAASERGGEVVRWHYRRPRPAQTYRHVWSNTDAFPCDCAPPRARWLPPPGTGGERLPSAAAPPNS